MASHPPPIALLCLLLLASLPLLLHAALYEDVAGALNASATGATWIAANHAVFSGFCLDPVGDNVSVIVNTSLAPLDSRLMTNWLQPLYSKPILMFAVDDSPIAFSYLWIVKLLLQEVMGYQVLTLDLPIDPLDLMIHQPGSLDVNPIHYVDINDPQPSYLLSIHDEVNLPGLYITQSSVDANPSLALDWWRTYDARSTAPDVVNASMALLLDDSWAGLVDQNNRSVLLLDDGSFVCPNDTALALTDDPPQGCINGMYTPPQCEASPRTDCAVIYHSDAIYDAIYMTGGTLQQIVKTLRLPFVVAFINPAIKASHIDYLNQHNKHVIFWAINLEELPHTACNETSTGLCYTRVLLPTYSYGCMAEVTQSPNGNYSCDYSPHPLFNMVLAFTSPQHTYWRLQTPSGHAACAHLRLSLVAVLFL